MNWIQLCGKERSWGVEIGKDKLNIATFFVNRYRVETATQEILPVFVAYKAGLELPYKLVACNVIEECEKEIHSVRETIPTVNENGTLCFDCLKEQQNIDNNVLAMFIEEEVDMLLERIL